MSLDRAPRAVLFDLDGTLADTAPDLIGALVRLRQQLGLPSIDPAPLRLLANRGAPAILGAGLPELAEAERAEFRQRYLDEYHAFCWHESRAFDGIPACLDAIELLGMRWGIVTNKLEWLAAPVVEQAGWHQRAGCLVAGDTAVRPKPAADPVLEACRRLSVSPGQVLFVGDDERDVTAGRAAGTLTAVAEWGYIDPGVDPSTWGADCRIDTPVALEAMLRGECERERLAI
ncbi:MAG: HAD family hydrolase [Wenzhouxiangellaceae bacterium]